MLAFLALLGAPYIYDISSLRVKVFCGYRLKFSCHKSYKKFRGSFTQIGVATRHIYCAQKFSSAWEIVSTWISSLYLCMYIYIYILKNLKFGHSCPYLVLVLVFFIVSVWRAFSSKMLQEMHRKLGITIHSVDGYSSEVSCEIGLWWSPRQKN